MLSLNGVGGEPDWMGDSSLQYHAFSQEQLRSHPFSMSTSSTHDTKRSEDVRSRIHIISELSDEWIAFFKASVQVAGDTTPSPRLQYLIFETLLGAWPLDGKVTKEFVARMKEYFLKAAREAKTETSWSSRIRPMKRACAVSSITSCTLWTEWVSSA